MGVPYSDQYLLEVDFWFNRQKISDAERFAALVSQFSGRRLTWYCQTPLTENPSA